MNPLPLTMGSSSSSSSSTGATLHQARLALLRRLLILVGLLLSFQQPTDAILNCFPSSMLKLNKGGYSMGYPPGADRASWYSQGAGYTPAFSQPMGHGGFYSGNPMKMWLQNKWKGGGMFGHKPRNSWKTAGGYLGSLQRPPYRYPQTSYPLFSPMGPGYQFSEQLSSVPYSTGGWSTPAVLQPLINKGSLIQQSPISVYDAPIKQQPLLYTNPDYSSGTKGASGSRLTNKNYLSATGYDTFDTISAALINNNKNMSSYSYPEWYTGVVESPAKIAQQLLKSSTQNIKSQRLRTLSQTPASTGFMKASNQFNILDEPRFNGFGKVDLLTAQEARLSCSFNEAINQSNKPLWIKFVGPYNISSSQTDSKLVPPFNCLDTQCRTKEIESSQDYRYSFDHGPATSTLIISEPRLSDYGVYRCSALTKALNNSPLETIYQIVKLSGSS